LRLDIDVDGLALEVLCEDFVAAAAGDLTGGQQGGDDETDPAGLPLERVPASLFGHVCFNAVIPSFIPVYVYRV
jgi:hypothetical protein